MVITASIIQRLKRVRTSMQLRNLDALLVYSQRRGHIPYLSGYRPNYHTNCAFMVLPAEGEAALLIKFGFDLPRARALSWVEDIRAGQSESTALLLKEFVDILEEKKLVYARLGLVASDDTIDEMSAALLDGIRQSLPSAHLEPASDIVNQLRISKDVGEIEVLRRATKIAESATATLARCLTPGAEDFVAVAQASAAAVASGATRCDVIISPDPSRLALPPSGRRFRDGNPVSVELTIECEGYWTQICRTFSIGPSTPLQKRIFAACRNGYDAAVALARPGAQASDLAKAAIAVVEKAGFPGSIKYGLGHGVGLDLPEPFSIDIHSPGVLVDRMVLVIHVGAWVEGAAAFVGGPIMVNGPAPITLHDGQYEIFELSIRNMVI